MSNAETGKDPQDIAALARTMSRLDILGRRGFGAWVDLIAVGLIVVTPAMIALILLSALLQPSRISSSEVELSTSVFGAIGVVIGLFYFPIMEGRWGRTLGKLITGTIVVDAQGNAPGYSKATVRTFTRLIEVNPLLLGGIPAGIALLCSVDRQRFGDYLAGTYVIPISFLRMPPLAQSEEEEYPSQHRILADYRGDEAWSKFVEAARSRGEGSAALVERLSLQMELDMAQGIAAINPSNALDWIAEPLSLLDGQSIVDVLRKGRNGKMIVRAMLMRVQ